MAVTNVFFEFPCFIDRWLVNINNNINSEYFVNKNDIIGHVRLDNNSITSFRAPVSGYLTILIREKVRVRKGVNVAAIYPNPRNTNTHSNAHSPTHQIQNIQNQLNHHQSNQFNARYQSQPQTMNPSQPPPHNINMNMIPHNIHPSNIPYHQIRHTPHHIPINNINNRPPHPPPPQYIHNRPPHPNYMHHPQPPPIYTNHQPPPHTQLPTHAPYPPPPQPYTPQNNNQTQTPIITEAKTNANTNNTNNLNIKTNVSITEKKTNKSPTDPRKSTSLSSNKSSTPMIQIKKNNTEIATNTTPNSMFTKHWNNKISYNNSNNNNNNSMIINNENISKIKTNLHKNKKLLLVLDIDHTLVHATRDIRAKDILSHEIIGEDVYEIEFIDPSCITIKQIYWVKLRPFLRKFLQVLKRFFCLAIYTMGIRPYADEILKIIDPDSSIFEHRMICRGDIGINQINGMKNISHLPQCDPKMILIADDRDDVWTTPSNVVKVHKFKYWPNENNLANIPNTMNMNIHSENININSDINVNVNMKNNIPIVDITQSETQPISPPSPTIPPPPPTREQLFPWNKDCVLEQDGHEPWNLERLKQKSNDNILYNTANILQAVHYVYYSNNNMLEDCRLIYGAMKQLVFRGVKCAFSGVIPTNEDPRNHPLWKLIETYGGEPTDCLSNDCTHLIAAKPGTFKVTKSNEMNIWVVHYNWVYQSVIEFVKCKEINYINLIKPNIISSFIPKNVHVKPKEFGERIKNIRNGIQKYPKIVTKHEYQKLQIQKEKERMKLKINNNNNNNNNKMAMDVDVKMEEKKESVNVKDKIVLKVENNNNNNINDVKMKDEIVSKKVDNIQLNNNDIEMDNNDNKKKKEQDEEEEEGEIKESSPTPPPPPEKISINEENNNNKQGRNVNIVINNNTKNDIVIQLPPPNSSKQITSKSLPQYIQLPKRNKSKKIIEKKDNNNNNNNKNVLYKDNNISLPPHIALPEKNKSKILAQHQSNVAKFRILNSDINTHHNTATQIIKDTQIQLQPQLQPQPPILVQPPKPQIIRLQAPKLNPLRCTVPTIPAHLRQQQYMKPTMIHQSNDNNYIPVSMQLPPPPNAHIQPPHNHSHIQPPHNHNHNHIQPPPNMHVIMPQPPLPNGIQMQMLPMHPPTHTQPQPMNIMHVIKPTGPVIPPPPPPLPLQPVQKKDVVHPGDKDHRKEKGIHKDYADIIHRNMRDRDRDRDRDRIRENRYHRSHRIHNKRTDSNSLSRSNTRSRSRSRSRSPHYNYIRKHRKRSRRSRSRSISPFYNRSHSSSLSSIRHRRDRDRNRNDRYRKENKNQRNYQIIGKKGYNKKNKRYEDNNWNDNDDDGFDQLLQSYAGTNNKYKSYNRYSDEEQKIDYGVNDNHNKDNGKVNEDSIDYGAI